MTPLSHILCASSYKGITSVCCVISRLRDLPTTIFEEAEALERTKVTAPPPNVNNRTEQTESTTCYRNYDQDTRIGRDRIYLLSATNAKRIRRPVYIHNRRMIHAASSAKKAGFLCTNNWLKGPLTAVVPHKVASL